MIFAAMGPHVRAVSGLADKTRCCRREQVMEWDRIEWAVVVLAISALAGIATFWKNLGRPLWASCGLPVCRYCWALARMPLELTSNGGGSVKDLAKLAIEQNERISQQVSQINARSLAWLSISPNAIFISDETGRCTLVNRSYMRLAGRGQEELIGSGWLNCVIESDRRRVEEAWQDCVDAGREFDMSYGFEHSNGKKFRVRVHAHVMTDERLKPVGYMGLVMREPDMQVIT